MHIQLSLSLHFYLLSNRSRQRERLHATGPVHCSSVCLFVCRQNTKMRFTQKLSSLRYWRPIESRTWAFQRTHYWTRKIHLENRHDVIFFCRGWSDLDKIRRLVQNDMSTAVIWPKSKPEVEFRYVGRLGEFNGMSSRSHLPHCGMLPPDEFNVMILELCVTLHGAATGRIHCHDSRATCHIAGCCHLANSMTCHPRATCHVAGCCHLVNSLSWFQSHMPHCRV